MATTTKGYRYPLGTEAAADIDTFIQNLAEDVDGTPGIAIVTTAQRDALSGAARWTGRTVYNTTTARLEFWNGAAWGPVATGTVMADAAPPAIADAGAVGDSTDAARENHTHAAHPQMAKKNTANTFTEDQTIEAGNILAAGGGAIGAETAAGGLYGSYNARWDGANYVRIVADNDAAVWNVQTNGDFVFYTNTDGNATAGSVITLGEKFRITKAGKLTVTKGVHRNVGSVLTGAITISTDSDVVLAGGASPYTITLPTAVGNGGKVFDIKRVGTADVTIDANGSETIDGALTHVLSAQYESRTLVSDGSNWHII